MKFYLILITVFFSTNTLYVQAETAYAEKPLVPDVVSKSFLAISIKKAIVPDVARVGAPVYPGAKIINSFQGTKPSDGNSGRLPFLELISEDSYAKVVAFYKEKLTGWTQGGFNTALYFAEKGKVNMFSPKSTHVGIHDVLTYYRENEQKDLQLIIPGARSLIKIFYTVD